MNMSGKKVLVMGLGRFGGGLGVTRWLLAQGADVVLTDLLTEKELSSQLQQFGTHERLRLVFGEHRKEDFENVDVVIANPAVKMPWDNQYLQAAWNAGVRVTTEIQLVVEQLDRNNVIGVTGSAGKSTTVSMIYAALQSCDMPTVLGGNIGGSLLQVVDEIDKDTTVVLELSSAMLWWLGDAIEEGWSPHVGVLTNVSPNHLDWHGTIEAYVACKENIFKFQEKGDFEIRSDQINTAFSSISMIGAHNKWNAASALQAVLAIGADEQLSRDGIVNFCGLPHRLERVGEFTYNDSKSTTPEATALAVDSFEDPSKIHLIVGGYDKQVDLSLISQQAGRVAGLYAIGETASAIICSVTNGTADNCGTLKSAVETATKNMSEGDILLLSPGCASLDQFDNYEQRGIAFCTLTAV
jgi:UDP-N-acetylmuramoylalanine--D-glutamate ligase